MAGRIVLHEAPTIPLGMQMKREKLNGAALFTRFMEISKSHFPHQVTFDFERH